MRLGAVAIAMAISSPAFSEPSDPNVLPIPERQSDEVSVTPDPAFEKECLSTVNTFTNILPDFGNDFGPRVFSKGATWGNIIRFEITNQNPERRTGIVCFQRSTDPKVGMAFYDLTTGTCKRYAGFRIYPPGAVPRQ
jgi:hypothetical protein